MAHHHQGNKNTFTFNLHIYPGAQNDRQKKDEFKDVNEQIHLHMIHNYISEYSRKIKYSLKKEFAEEFEKDMAHHIHILQR